MRFLRHLPVCVPGKLLVIWGGALIRDGAARRPRLERLPGYALDLNPFDQGIWHHVTV